MQKHTENSLHPPHSLPQFIPFRTSYKPFPHMQKDLCMHYAPACVHVSVCAPHTERHWIMVLVAVVLTVKEQLQPQVINWNPEWDLVKPRKLASKNWCENNMGHCAFGMSTKSMLICWYTWDGRKKVTYMCLLFLETLVLSNFIIAVKMQIYVVFNPFLYLYFKLYFGLCHVHVLVLTYCHQH